MIKRFELIEGRSCEPCMWWLRSAVMHDALLESGLVNGYGEFVSSHFVYTPVGMIPACMI